MEAFTERLANLADLSPEDLDALANEIISAFESADADGNLDLMEQLADALDQVREAASSAGGVADNPATPDASAPAPDAAAPVAASAEADVETAPVEAPADVEAPVAETEVVTDAEIATESSNDEEAAPEGDANEVTATSTEENEVAEITADSVPDENRPDEEALEANASGPIIRVGGDVPGYTAGSELSSFDEAIEAMTAKVNSMRGIGGDGEHLLVASITNGVEPTEERMLRPGDADGNAKKIRALISDPEQLTPEALTAAGWCAPKAPVYDVPTIGTTDRPVRDALPSFNADRGGITWMQPPGLPAGGMAGALGGWRYDTGEAVWESYDVPGGADAADSTVKNMLTIPCGTETNAELEALTLGLCFDNMMARAFPEWIRANTELTMVAQARWAEQFLLNKIWAGIAGNSVGNPDTAMGSARDFLTSMRLAASQFRWRNRLSRTQPLQLLVPSWLRDAIAADLLVQMPGEDKMSVADSEVDGYLSDINVQPIWFVDDVPVGSGASTAVASASLFDAYTGYPQSVEWLLFPTGAFVRLDNGSLDLGIVRTKEDVQKNKYCEFSETFETVAYMGPAIGASGWALRGTTTVTVRGGFAQAVASVPSGGTIIE
jgi:hypothetical protein